ncbi:hypothetical protein XELAEV_18022074mg [Xenopus laevis]|uniref:Uncharacterized protein n=1 Tax=Xenopus laevis TaxID=8355 RepID=A0A974D3Q1_XENLA|nr:hypothetical protein XELAEV_18022074mg [Xenopus laevis]
MDNRSGNLDVSCGDVAQSPGNNVVLSWGPVFCLPLQWTVVYYTPRQKVVLQYIQSMSMLCYESIGGTSTQTHVHRRGGGNVDFPR